MTKPKTVQRSKVEIVPRAKTKPVAMKNKISSPVVVPPTAEPKQRGVTVPPYFFRFIPSWNTPSWFEAKRWRLVVRNQPIAMICKEALQSMISSLDWIIVPKDTTQLDSLKAEVDYYTDILTDDGNYDFVDRAEWLIQDLLDLPFGAAVEVGREGDEPEGKVLWMVPLDGATLFPTLNSDFPIGQYVTGFNITDPIYFPKHAIDRVYMTPRTEIERIGWGMAPPEKIYLALEMLARGDRYWANLLLDTPEAGILDLGDMAKDTAEQWVLSYRDLLSGVDPFKIPVLYEHEREAKYIPFGKPPTDLMFDRISLKYAAFTAAGYGLTLGDIGLMQSSGNGGETLAGSIREERKSRRSGRAICLRKLRNFYNRLLPKTLQFNWIDQDDELNQGIARARLANATALGILQEKGIIDAAESRLQLIADHLFTITLPEKRPPTAQPTPENAPVGEGGNSNPDVADQVNRPVPPSLGGHGDIKRSSPKTGLTEILHPQFESIVGNLSDLRLRRLIRRTLMAILPSIQRSIALSTDDELIVENSWIDEVLDGTEDDIENYATLLLDTVSNFVSRNSELESWWKVHLTEENYQKLQRQYEEWFSLHSNDLLRRLTAYLYEHEYIEQETTPKSVDVKSSVILGILLSRVKDMIYDIDKGTQTFLSRALLSIVRQELVATGMTELLRQGVDMETVMSNNIFIDVVSKGIRDRLQSDFRSRVENINQYEQDWVANHSVLEQLSALGLQEKIWEHFGDDIPCTRYCQPNINAGIVPLGYKYETCFGASKAGPGHLFCHCRVNFVPAEVQRNIASGIFPITNWRGA